MPGGRSIARVAEYLAAEDLPWSAVHVFLVDERCVSVNDTASNYQALRHVFFEPLLNSERIARDNVHLPQEIGRSNCDAETYTHELAGVAPSGEAEFDVVFPDHPSVRETGRRFIISDNAPKAPPRRVSASRELIENASTAVVLFLGEGKQEAMRDFRHADSPVEERPCRMLYRVNDAWAATDLA